ncbi:PucR family transcriptional regulator [Agromyces sp. GXS1127]|uniref:PucR family transcriptional regulator n=1 Tax=Agromyces sp. GXS1127 TaxID=3424181 RepID=UPI003D31A6D2
MRNSRLATSPTTPAAPAVPWLPLLRPSAAQHSLVPASSGAQYARVVSEVGADAAQWAVEVGLEVAERVAAEIPGHIAEGGLDVLRMGTESTTIQLLLLLSGAEVEGPATSEALGGIPDFVRRRVSLDELLRGIQLGHSVIAGAFLAECARLGDPEQRHEQMRTLSQRMFAFFDAFSTQMAASYREEEARWVKSDAASRLAVVEDLLRGHDQPLAVVSRRLRYDLARSHVALVVWSSARTLDADQTALHEAARDLVRHSGAEQSLVLAVNLGMVWAWATPRSTPEEFVDRLASMTLPADTHAVIGGTGRGLAGFRASHDDALAAFGLRSSSTSTTSVTPYRDLDLISLLLADRDRAIRFARAELGPLAATDPTAADLRRTVAAYLDLGGSPQAAAQRLSVSRNTVTYRVRRAEELLGQPLTERRQHLQAALAILAETESLG